MRREEKWFNNYQRLHCFTETFQRLPFREEDPKLCQWVYCQRTHKDKLTKEQQHLLEQLTGFTWVIKKLDDWWEHYQRVLTTVKTTGALPQNRDVECGWLYRQRKNKNKLSKEQQRKLEALPGFTWEMYKRSTWRECYDNVMHIIETTGEPPTQKNHPREYNWLNRQLNSKNKLTDEQQELLKALYVSIRGKNKQILPAFMQLMNKNNMWKENYQYVTGIIETTGESLNPDSIYSDAFEWLYWQGTHKSALTMKQRESLEKIPGFTWLTI